MVNLKEERKIVRKSSDLKKLKTTIGYKKHTKVEEYSNIGADIRKRSRILWPHHKASQIIGITKIVTYVGSN